jgi:hypothetical protein
MDQEIERASHVHAILIYVYAVLGGVTSAPDSRVEDT